VDRRLVTAKPGPPVAG